MAIPTLIFALLVLTVLGTSIPVLILVIAVLDSTRVFRLARSLAVNIAAQDFVEVARLRGERLPWILARELLPNALPTLVAEFGLRFCFVFLFIAALSFLGLGVQPPNADWGGMVRENAQAINFGLSAPLIPAAAIAVLTIAVNLVVDWFLARATVPPEVVDERAARCGSATSSSRPRRRTASGGASSTASRSSWRAARCWA